MRFRRERREDLDVNITPLIDVVFLLLIFFMVSSTFERDTQIAVQLPQATGKPLKAEPHTIEVTIDAKGRYFVNRKELINTQQETLKKAMSDAAAGDKKPRVILSADRHTEHQAVIEAMDAAMQLGFVHLTFATMQPGTGNK